MNIFKEIFKKETRYILYVTDYSRYHSYSTIQTGFKPILYHITIFEKDILNIKLIKTRSMKIGDICKLDFYNNLTFYINLTLDIKLTFADKLKLILNKNFIINYMESSESVFIKEYSNINDIINDYIEELL